MAGAGPGVYSKPEETDLIYEGIETIGACLDCWKIEYPKKPT